MKSLSDSIGGMSDFYFAQGMSNTNSTIEQIIDNVAKVKSEDIVKAFEEIELDIVYFLRN